MPRRKPSAAQPRREPTPGAFVYAYCRDSGGAQQEKSIADQRAELVAYADRHGLVIAGWYVDEARSGADADSRPAFQEMVHACRSDPPPVAGVLVWALSRFARDELDAQFYKADLRRRGVEIISLTDAAPDGPFAHIYEALVAWKDAQYLADLAGHVKRGQRANVMRGFAHGGRPPYGYRAERVQIGTHRNGQPRYAARWVVDEATAPLVLRAFEMRAQGYAVETILETLGLPLTVNGLAYLLRSPSYGGVLRYGDEWLPGAIPALVPPDLLAQVQGRPRFKRLAHSAYLLSGIFTCGLCGGPMHGKLSRSRGYVYRYYLCDAKRRKLCDSPAIRAEDAEQIAMLLVTERWLSPPVVWGLLQEALEARDEALTTAEAERIAADTARLRLAIARLLDLAEEGEDVRERLRQRRAELARLEGQAVTLTHAAHAGQISYGEVEEFCQYMRGELRADDIPRARRVVRQLAERFVWHGMRIEAVWREGVL